VVEKREEEAGKYEGRMQTGVAKNETLELKHESSFWSSGNTVYIHTCKYLIFTYVLLFRNNSWFI